MIGEIIGEVAGAALRFIGRILLEGVFEILIKGAGYMLCRPFGSRKLDPMAAWLWLQVWRFGLRLERESMPSTVTCSSPNEPPAPTRNGEAPLLAALQR
jgi:hypothetical protein